MTDRPKLLTAAFIAMVAAAGLAAAIFWRNPAVQPVTLATGTYLPARALPDFSLIDQAGREFTRAGLAGRWSLLFFGYTNCPDLCPATLTTLAAMEKAMRAAGDPVRPQVVFVSVDARRDTPQQLARYVPNFDPQFIGLTAATQTGIEAMAAGMGVAVSIRPQEGGAYSVDHTGAIFVIDPVGRLRAILTGPFGVDALRTDFQRIVAAPA
jgi:protein SCO1/2